MQLMLLKQKNYSLLRHMLRYFYKDLIADSGVSYGAWAFPKTEVAISNIGGTTIHPNILAAYKELCE